MDKTPFAGLTRLDLSDSLDADGGSFKSINPTIIDRLLELGARTHRHNGAGAIAPPTAPAAMGPGASGGFIPGATLVSLTYTLVDQRGGETLPAPVTSFTTAEGVTAPDEAPDFIVEATGGHKLAGTYYYYLSLTDGSGGESTVGPVITVDVDPGTSTNQVRFEGLGQIASDYGAAGWRLYKSSQFGTPHFLAAGNVALDELVDDGTLCVDCTASPPSQNTTGSTNSIDYTVPVHPANEAAGVVAYRVYLGLGGDFSSPSLVAQYDVATLGDPRTIATLLTNLGTPPDVPTAMGGANKIDPDTEILNFHWKPPVATIDDLAVGELGDVRATLDTGMFYIVLGPSAETSADWTAVGGSSTAGHTIADEGTPVTPRSVLDFAGAGVTLTDNAAGDRTVVTIPGASAGGGGASGAVTLAYPQEITWTGSGGVNAKVYTRQESLAIDGVTENHGWFAAAYATTNNELIVQAGGNTLTPSASGLVPSDTTEKRFTWAGAYSSTRDLTWMDTIRLIMRFDIQTGHIADWGQVAFGIEDTAGNVLGLQVGNALAHLGIIEVPSGGSQSILSSNSGGAPVVGTNWLVFELLGNQVLAERWITDPLVAGNTPANTLLTDVYSTPHWWRGMGAAFRPWVRLRPGATTAVTYFKQVSGPALRVEHGRRRRLSGTQPQLELWSAVGAGASLVQGAPDPWQPIPAFHLNSASVTSGTISARRVENRIQLRSDALQVSSSAVALTSGRLLPRRLWPMDKQTFFVPYTSPTTAKSGEVWEVTTGGIIWRYGVDTVARDVAAQASWDPAY